MLIKSAAFVISSSDPKKCPKPNFPEYAFVGRSNVGKSSLINTLTGRRKLAKISGAPGKTQLINHFLINKKWYLTDLPGYGYAKASKKDKEKWKKMTENYILNRTNLLCLFVLIDSRLDPQKSDMEFMGWLGKNQIPFTMVFTKTDKLSKRELDTRLANYKKQMLETWEELPHSFSTSAITGFGKNEILDFIEKTNKIFKM